MESVKIQNLLNYAKYHLGLNPLDEIYVRNRLLEATFENEFENVEGNIDVSLLDCPDKVIDPILDTLISNNLIEEYDREKYLCKLMDIVSLKPSEIESKFEDIYKNDKLKAFSYLYDYSNKNGYVKYSKINENIKWEASNTKHPIEITINLSKPEKTISDIKSAATAKTNYPKCVICLENMGYVGGKTIKQNLRGKQLKVNNEDWFFQYSPYGYFNEHSILLNTNHTKMVVKTSNVTKLLDFIDIVPEYFIGFNAALPIVGGSILAHDHYQAGRYTLPMMKAKRLKEYKLENNSSKIAILDWYNSAIEVRNTNREELEKVTSLIIESWEKYSDIDNNIIAYDIEPHNSITAISLKEKDEYVVQLILRNNITSDKYPEGVYHAHPEYYNIKQEGIGLIEAAGMFILPARLKRQLNAISDRLSGVDSVWLDDMNVHKDMYNRLVEKYGTNNSKEKAKDIVKEEVNRICECILYNTAVFKDTNKGNEGFENFMTSMGMKKQ